MPSELKDAPKCPDDMYYLWEWYKEILTPPDRITYQEIDAWSRMTGHSLLECEIKVIRALDNVRQRVMNDG